MQATYAIATDWPRGKTSRPLEYTVLYADYFCTSSSHRFSRVGSAGECFVILICLPVIESQETLKLRTAHGLAALNLGPSGRYVAATRPPFTPLGRCAVPKDLITGAPPETTSCFLLRRLAQIGHPARE
jgi:hypothetical protein